MTQNQRGILGLAMALGLFGTLVTFLLTQFFYPPFGYFTAIVSIYALAYAYKGIENLMISYNYKEFLREEEEYSRYFEDL